MTHVRAKPKDARTLSIGNQVTDAVGQRATLVETFPCVLTIQLHLCGAVGLQVGLLGEMQR